MHVGLNLVFLIPGATGGMEAYARSLAAALVRERPDARFTAFVNREEPEDSWRELMRTVTVPVHASRRVEWVRGEQYLLPRLAAREGVDVLHSLGITAPTWGDFRRVVTIHDLIYQLFPGTHPLMRTLGLRVLVPLGAHRSHRVIVSSHATRADVIRLLHVRAEKIDVVYLGHADLSARATGEESLRRQYGLGDRPVVLEASGHKVRHKNLDRLLDAFALIPPERRPVLVLTGGSTEFVQDLRTRTRELSLDDDVRFTGWMPSADIEGMYRLAACLVFPSLYEGFGLPIVDAMARGLPVASSQRGALAEVAGGAALLFDPERTEEIARAIETILGDEREAERLRALGLERARRFTWSATARATLASYERALSIHERARASV